MTTLDTALLRAVSAHPGLTFVGLLDDVRSSDLDVSATEIDAAARALGLEHGEPGAYRYRLPGSVAVGGDVREDEGEHGLAPPGLRGVAVTRHEPLSGLAQVELSLQRERGEERLEHGGEEAAAPGATRVLSDRSHRRGDGRAKVIHPYTIASSPAQSTLPGMWR